MSAEYLVLNGTSLLTYHHQDSQNARDEGTGKHVRAGEWRGVLKVLSSRHNKAVALLASQQLWLPT